MSVLTIILAGGVGKMLSVLTAQRSKPALPFGGKYRIIDFALSNVVNSGLDRIAILAQFKHESLAEHLGQGEPWGLSPDRLQFWLPSLERTGHEAYVGTADAVYQNQRYIAETGCDTVLILAGDHIYYQNFADMLRFHQEKGAALTIATMPVPASDMGRFGILNVDETQQITWFIEKPGSAPNNQASKGIYIFNTDFLLRYLEEDAHNPESWHDFGSNVIPLIVETGRAYAYPFSEYWADIGTIDTYWKTNLALLGDEPGIQLNNPSWPILTRLPQKPPTTVRPTGHVMNSLISEGCMIEGEVMHSILSPGVTIERGALVRDSVILNDTIIRAGAVVSGCVVDKQVEIGAQVHLGAGGDLTPNHEEPKLLANGITAVGKGAHIPAGLVVGRNCRIDPFVTADDFQGMGLSHGSDIPSGTTVHKQKVDT
jgi:glucose-1-phosphate adenylyltransferase